MVEIRNIEKKLTEKEEAMDQINSIGRIVIRACSNAIKALHAKDEQAAAAYLEEAGNGLGRLVRFRELFPLHINHVLQEYAEARIVFEAVSKKRIPELDELGVSEVAYLNGLLDSIGELKREMYEALRRNDRKEAERYFGLMENIYDSLLPLRFSNAILPDFRRKQDIARMQIEQARGELI